MSGRKSSLDSARGIQTRSLFSAWPRGVRVALAAALLFPACPTAPFAASACELPASDFRHTIALCKSLPEWLAAIPRPHRLGDLDLALSEQFVARFGAILDSIEQGSYEDAAKKADLESLTIGLIGGVSDDLVALYPVDSASVAPTLLVNPNWSVDAVVEAPHGAFEAGTITEGSEAILDFGVHALLVSGVERCASTRPSPCEGTTTVCSGQKEPYRFSDEAHNAVTGFGRAHSALAKRWPTAVFVQLHGMRRDGPGWAVLSDGTHALREKEDGLPERVRDRLRKAIGGGEDRVVSCQSPVDVKAYKPKLCARDNVQGRELNGSSDACKVEATQPSGRFLHIEQTWDVLGSGSPGRAVLEALFGDGGPIGRRTVPDNSPSPKH